jgi:hypothetical protein
MDENERARFPSRTRARLILGHVQNTVEAAIASDREASMATGSVAGCRARARGRSFRAAIRLRLRKCGIAVTVEDLVLRLMLRARAWPRGGDHVKAATGKEMGASTAVLGGTGTVEAPRGARSMCVEITR